MYSERDYSELFQEQDLSSFTNEQFKDLFKHCLKSDSMKLALVIYLKHLKNNDIDVSIMDYVIDSLHKSVRFHEQKLFFVHQHFGILNVLQLNRIIDIFTQLFQNPS